MKYEIKAEDTIYDIQVERLEDRSYQVSLMNRTHLVDVLEISESLYSMICDGKAYEVDLVEEGDYYEVFVKGRSYRLEILRPGKTLSIQPEGNELPPSSNEEAVTTPMPCMIVKILVEAEETVETDQALLIVEAMKMEMPISSVRPGKVKEVLVKEGQTVDAGASLITLLPL